MGQSQTILFVEDEKEVLQRYKVQLEKAGFTIIEAADGEKGLKLALEKHPDLIFIDILLPKMDGMEMLKRLRNDLWGKRVPVIMITNLDSPHIINKTIQLGVYDYLVKSQWSIEDVVLKAKIRLSGVDNSK